jgi:hypothetical protein
MATSLFRKTIAGIALAGGVLAGSAGIASAEAGTEPQRPTQEQVCQKAGVVWERLVAFDGKLHEQYRKLGEARDKATAEGKTELAEKLTQRMARLKNRHDVLVERMRNLHDRVAEKCELSDAPVHPVL